MPEKPLSYIEHIRSRPAVYIGGCNPRDRRVMLLAIIEDLLNLPGAERPRVTLTIGSDGVAEIEAQGAASDVSPELLLAHPEDERNFSLIIAAALSDPLDVEITRAGHTAIQSFYRGVANGPPREHKTDCPARTHLRLRPDPTRFKDTTLDFYALCALLQSLALFHPTAALGVVEQTTGMRREFHYPRGLLDYMSEVEPGWIGDADFGQCRYLDLTDGQDRIRAAILRRPNGPLVAQTFVNGQRVVTGPHIDGFRDALADIAKSPILQPDRRFRPVDDPTDNLTVVFALDLANPEYANSTKDCLTGPRPKELAYRATLEQLPAQMG